MQALNWFKQRHRAAADRSQALRERQALALQLRQLQDTAEELRRQLEQKKAELAEASRAAADAAAHALQVQVEHDAALKQRQAAASAALDEHNAALKKLQDALDRVKPSGRVMYLKGNTAQQLDAVRTCLRLLTPQPTGLAFKRYGHDQDGGYVLADLHVAPRRAIALGVGDETTFDRALLDAGYTVHQYDDSIDAPAAAHPGLHFNKLRVVGIDPGRGETTLDAIVEQVLAGNDPAASALLKCDIEYSEWPLLEHVSPATLARLHQMTFEFHGLHLLHDKWLNAQRRACLEKILLGHAPVHIHANNCGHLIVNDSFSFPNIVEVTFLRRDLLGPPAAAPTQFPTALDRPNDPTHPDLFLGPFMWQQD